MKKQPRKIPTLQNLTNVALHYLGRYAASEASLRRVLQNRLRRAALDRPEFAADYEKQKALRSVIETIIEGHKKTGALNDAAFAEVKINSLRRQGRSRRAIEQKLTLKGIDRTVAAKAFDRNDEGIEPEDVERQAALKFAKRRKLGPFSVKIGDPHQQRKDIATMARAGFSFALIKAVLGHTIASEDELDFEG
jgi:regulatory protein